MNVLVLGAYGLIGQAVAGRLLTGGAPVVGLARSARRGRATLPTARWIEADISHLLTPADWAPYLDGIDAVVNAAGALQSGRNGEDLSRLQRDAIVALIEASETAGVTRFVQISAPGAAPTASTEFLATKGAADDRLRQSRLSWVILKPGLVIAPTAYGGTALLRTLAAVPLVQPLVLASSPVQTVAVDDVARAVERALADDTLQGRVFDLVEPQAHDLRTVVLAFRRWLGFAEPRRIIELPDLVGRLTARLADLAGHLGWRAPLRSTALAVMRDGVQGDPEPWRAATGETLSRLDQTLAALPATRQERVFARASLAFPLVVTAFALFWIASGVIGIWQRPAAEALISAMTGPSLATLAVVGGALADIAVGAALLGRRTFRAGCLAAVAVSLAYLGLGSLLTPALWADPLGPLVKIVPVIALAALLAAVAEER